MFCHATLDLENITDKPLGYSDTPMPSPTDIQLDTEFSPMDFDALQQYLEDNDTLSFDEHEFEKTKLKNLA